jgi:DinB superfamily
MNELPELLERFRRGPELLAMATTGAAGPELDFKPADTDEKRDRWSVRQIVCHLADTEAVCAMRFRQVIAEDNPSMPGFDGAAWARSLDYEKRKISQVLEIVRVLRASNYELLNSLPPATYERAGTHSEMGNVTLLDLLRTYAEHLEGHVRQVQTTRAAYRENKTKLAAAAAAEKAVAEPLA